MRKVFPEAPAWVSDRTSRIPLAACTNDALHRREFKSFFYSKHRCCVGLEAEAPGPGDFKRMVIGERSMLLVHDADGQVNVVENVRAHRGMQVCRERPGWRKEFACLFTARWPSCAAARSAPTWSMQGIAVHTAEDLRFAAKLVVYDREMIPNSIISPI